MRAVHQATRNALLFISLILITVGIPIFSIVYLPGWYDLNCRWHDRCERLGMERSTVRIRQLVSFFRHAQDLPDDGWTRKERRHLAEVRNIFDNLLIGFGVCATLLIALWNTRKIRRLAVINCFTIFSVSAVLPFFEFFWRDVFHGLLFDNTYWLNTPNDISYYITPRVFFFHTVIFIVGAAALINIGLYGFLRSVAPERTKNEPPF